MRLLSVTGHELLCRCRGRCRRWFRIRSVTVDTFQIQFDAEDDLTHGDVEGAWVGSTYGDVSDKLDGLTYQKAFLVGAYEES